MKITNNKFVLDKNSKMLSIKNPGVSGDLNVSILTDAIIMKLYLKFRNTYNSQNSEYSYTFNEPLTTLMGLNIIIIILFNIDW